MCGSNLHARFSMCVVIYKLNLFYVIKRVTLNESYLHIPGELIVAVDMNSREFSDMVEFEFDLERMSGPCIVLPADPSLTSVIGVIVTHLKVVRSGLAVRQLSQAAEKLSVPITVISRVKEFPVVALVTLRHRVRDDAIVPRTAVQFNAHANRATMITVG